MKVLNHYDNFIIDKEAWGGRVSVTKKNAYKRRNEGKHGKRICTKTIRKKMARYLGK